MHRLQRLAKQHVRLGELLADFGELQRLVVSIFKLPLRQRILDPKDLAVGVVLVALGELLEILTRITEGNGVPEDIEKLERLCHTVQRASLCGLGRSAPNPVLSTLRHFRDEYEAHINEKRCPAHACLALLRYFINPEKCVGCTLCARVCPVNCISGSPRNPHVIDQTRCIHCGQCMAKCRFEAIYKE
jgi:NAD-dependent dihydropyrimidine dehydrogenase PreA subunit